MNIPFCPLSGTSLAALLSCPLVRDFDASTDINSYLPFFFGSYFGGSGFLGI